MIPEKYSEQMSFDIDSFICTKNVWPLRKKLKKFLLE